MQKTARGCSCREAYDEAVNALSTRVLLICAAIGVASGLAFVLTGGLHAAIIATAPILYGPLIAIYYLPGAIALPLLRIPGTGLVTALFAGFLAAISPLQPLGFGAMGWIAVIGLVQELAFAVSLYRYWKLWPAIVVAILSGLFFAVGFHFAFHMADLYPTWLVIGQFVLTAAATVLATVIGWVIAARLRATGAYRPRGGTATVDA